MRPVTDAGRHVTGGTMHMSTTRLLASSAAFVLAVGGVLTALPASAASTPACTNSDLTASYRHSDDGAGHRYGWIVLRNTSGHGGVSYVGDGDGTQIGASAVRIDATDVKTFVVKAGGRLRSPIDEVSAFNFPRKKCHRAHVDGFRVYVPNATLSQYVPHPTVGCRSARVHLLYQKPYRRP
jgi:hypothetical protein